VWQLPNLKANFSCGERPLLWTLWKPTSQKHPNSTGDLLMGDPRVGVRLSVKVSTGNYGSVGLELSEERDLSDLGTAGQTRAAILERLTGEMAEWKQKQNAPKPAPTPVGQSTAKPIMKNLAPSPQPVTSSSKEVLATPQSGSLASINSLQLSDELDRAAWRENSNGKGWHVKFDDLPQPIRAKLAGKLLNEVDKSGYLHLNGFVYKRFGDEGRMLARYATKAGDLTK
jgi:hypothetical protein